MNGLITLPSNFGPEETMNRLEAEIKAHGMSIFTRIQPFGLGVQAGNESATHRSYYFRKS